MVQPWENLVTDGQTDRRTSVISEDAVRLTSSIQTTIKEEFSLGIWCRWNNYFYIYKILSFVQCPYSLVSVYMKLILYFFTGFGGTKMFTMLFEIVKKKASSMY